MRKRILKKVLLMVLIFVILFSFFNGYYIKVNAEDGVTPISAGTKVILPDESEVKQYGCATYEQEDISWYPGTGQEKVNKLWEAGGKLTDENNWAYIKTPDGVNRYLVAVTPLFGNAGDYLDIHTKDGKTIPCVMGDAKGNDSGGGVIGWYMYKGQPIGHKYDNGTCCVLEILLKDYNKIPSQDFLNSLNPVEWIQNGGSCLNGGMPVGLNNTYNFGTGGGSENIDGDDESETFLGALNMLFRNLWDSSATSFENSVSGRNDTTVLYDIKNLSAGSGSNSSSNSNASGITDSQVKAIYEEFVKNKGKKYIQDHSNLNYDKCMDYYDCSSWTIHCLAHAGVKKLPDSTAAGLYTFCDKVDVNDRKPGDLIFLQNTYTTGISHVGIYLGKFTVDGETAEWITDTGGNKSGGVKISKYNNGWWNGEHFYAFGRLKN
ncbi:MAG: NlpC/P60 family protein [Clostridia bacterium]|jgi:hypothetical protein